MAITIPVDNVAVNPQINMEEFRKRVTEFATVLWDQMVRAKATEERQAKVKHHTSARISALSLKGDQPVSADIDEQEAIYLEKYA